MSSLPYTILSSAISLDGYIDDTSSHRLILSHEADLERVDALRASCDAILVGANTIRADNPRLNIRSNEYIKLRRSLNKPKNLVKVTLTSSGQIPVSASFFAASDNAIYIYCTEEALNKLPDPLQTYAVTLPGFSEYVDLNIVLQDLKKRGIEKLLIEGGSQLSTAVLSSNLVHEFQLAIAPFFLGETLAPRFVQPGVFPFNKHNRMHLESVEVVGDMAVLTYILHNP